MKNSGLIDQDLRLESMVGVNMKDAKTSPATLRISVTLSKLNLNLIVQQYVDKT